MGLLLLINDFVFQSLDFERTWWRLFQKHVVWTKFDIITKCIIQCSIMYIVGSISTNITHFVSTFTSNYISNQSNFPKNIFLKLVPIIFHYWIWQPRWIFDWNQNPILIWSTKRTFFPSFFPYGQNISEKEMLIRTMMTTNDTNHEHNYVQWRLSYWQYWYIKQVFCLRIIQHKIVYYVFI